MWAVSPTESQQAGQWWWAGACHAALGDQNEDTVSSPAEEALSARAGDARSYRPPATTLTHFMPEIFKLFLSNRPIDCGKARVTTELNHATLSITHLHFLEKETRVSGMSPASKPSGRHTASKQFTRSSKVPISKGPSVCFLPFQTDGNSTGTSGQPRERGNCRKARLPSFCRHSLLYPSPRPRDKGKTMPPGDRVTYRSFINAKSVEGHSGEEFTIVAPPERGEKCQALL